MANRSCARNEKEWKTKSARPYGDRDHWPQYAVTQPTRGNDACVGHVVPVRKIEIFDSRDECHAGPSVSNVRLRTIWFPFDPHNLRAWILLGAIYDFLSFIDFEIWIERSCFCFHSKRQKRFKATCDLFSYFRLLYWPKSFFFFFFCFVLRFLHSLRVCGQVL